mgnify:CR=1 FL=1|jgi:zinc carboxypeptidase family protein
MNYFRQDSIISTNVNYSYNVFIKDLHKLTSLYPFISVGSIGKSIMGKDIPFIKIGNGSNEVFYSASYHANEWITSIVLMKFLADYCYCYSNNLTIFGYPASWLFNVSTIYLVPMVNPDGVDLVTGALPTSSPSYTQASKIAYGFATIPFPNGWKANIRGVDLKNFQPFCKALHCLIYTALLVFPFSFIISSILINSSKFSVIEFNFEKLKYI